MPGTLREYSYLKNWVRNAKQRSCFSATSIRSIYRLAASSWQNSAIPEWYWRVFSTCNNSNCNVPLVKVSNPKAFEICETLNLDSNARECELCSNCDSCCACRECQRCGLTSSNTCSHCDNCDNCCRCVRCANCRLVTTEQCPRCGCCRNNSCCTCPRNIITFTESRNRKPFFHAANKLQFKLNGSKRFLANEIEVAGLRRDGIATKVSSVINKWRGLIVHDGSLPANGFEINTSPANGDVYVKQVNEVCAVLSAQKAFVTKQCGLHVHIDARDYNYYDIRRLIKLYAKIEGALFMMVPALRRTSNYCRPCAGKYLKGIDTNHPKQLKRTFCTNMYGTHKVQDYRTQKYNGNRYNALNIHSWFYRGTVECRMFGPTLNPQRIINWSTMWAQILDWCYHASDADENDLKYEISRDGIRILKKIVKTQEVRDFIENRLIFPVDDEIVEV